MPATVSPCKNQYSLVDFLVIVVHIKLQVTNISYALTQTVPNVKVKCRQVYKSTRFGQVVITEVCLFMY